MSRNMIGFMILVCLCVSVVVFGQIRTSPGNRTESNIGQPEDHRIAVNHLNTPGDENSVFKITDRGSYYLANNVNGETGKSGIEIAASHVTLDLNGFILDGSGGSIDGVSFPYFVINITIKNGSIIEWGRHGINGHFVSYGSYFDLNIYDNGEDGLSAGPASIIYNCQSIDNEGIGFRLPNGASVIRDSIAYVNGEDGIRVDGLSSIIKSCVSQSNFGSGIVVGSGNVIHDNSISVNRSHGLDTHSSNTIYSNTIMANVGNGIGAFSNNFIRENLIHNNGFDGSGYAGDASGIDLESLRNRIENNLLLSNDRGITAGGAEGNLIIGNQIGGNTLGDFNGIETSQLMGGFIFDDTEVRNIYHNFTY